MAIGLLEREPLALDVDGAAAPATRVLHVINGEHYAGAERVQDLLALRLGELGFEVGFACTKPHHFARLRQSQDAFLVETPMRGKFDVRPARALARLVRTEGYALLHAHTPRSLVVARAAAMMTGLPLVYHVHSPTMADTTHPWRNRINAAVERLCLRGVDAVIAVSESLARTYGASARLASSRITVVHNGVATPAALAARPTPSGPWTLGTVALFRPRKGLEVLLGALAILKALGRRVRLKAVGPFESPDYEISIRQRAEQLGVLELVDWRGFSAHVGAELATLDLFVLPSLFGEGLPMVVLEAMAAGVPVVATGVEGVPEAVRHGVDGLLACPGDAESLATEILQVVDGHADWQSLRTSAYFRQRELFSDSSMARGVAGVYRKVLARCRRK